MSFRARTLIALTTLLSVIVCGHPTVVAQSSLQQVTSGLASPLYVTHVPGDTDRIFMLEQGSGGTARIKVTNLNTSATSTFLTIGGLATGGERGLLGLAFHPDYANNGFFYVNVTVANRTEIRRYRALGDPATSNTGDPASLAQVMRYNQPFTNHNGGWMGFNPTTSDPYLYIATGDGGSGGDPFNNAQDITNNRLGKMLRINVDGDDFPTNPNENYSIPADNPFVGTVGDDEIWSYGLRNPWRNSFDRATGDLWMGDVGQNQREEINFEPAGAGGRNYGWRVMEANLCNDNSQTGGNPPCNDPSLTPPIYAYLRGFGTFQGSSTTGGYVYHGSVPQYEGMYFFGDFVSNHIWTIDPLSIDPASSVRSRDAELPPNVSSISGLSSFGEDADGELYVTSYGGRVYRLSSTSTDAVWNGDDPGAGNPGDGATWTSANNWTRGGNVDTAFVAKDEVVFVPGSSQLTLNLGADRVVGGVRFEENYTLSGNRLQVLSGHVRVAPGITATINSDLAAETAAAALRKLDDGRLNVNGMTGQTVVLAGTLGGTGTINYLRNFSGATVSPGMSLGQLVVTNDYDQAAGAKLEIELGNANVQLPNDVLSVGDAATLAGELAVLIGDGYVEPERGTVDQFFFLNAATVDGTFDEVTFEGTVLTPTFPPDETGSFRSHQGDGLFQGVIYDETTVSFFSYSALGGDANGDGTVDGLDYLVWNEFKFQSGTDWLSGDFTGDGITDGQDFLAWNANKFTSVEVPFLIVPEPSGCFLLAWAAVCLIRRRR